MRYIKRLIEFIIIRTDYAFYVDLPKSRVIKQKKWVATYIATQVSFLARTLI